jgi:hypothetical protein
MTTEKQFERMKQKFIKQYGQEKWDKQVAWMEHEHQLSLEIKQGDLVQPTPENMLPWSVYFHWNKNARASFPWRVHKVNGVTIYLERPSKSGKIRIESFAIGFWQKYQGDKNE